MIRGTCGALLTHYLSYDMKLIRALSCILACGMLFSCGGGELTVEDAVSQCYMIVTLCICSDDSACANIRTVHSYLCNPGAAPAVFKKGVTL